MDKLANCFQTVVSGIDTYNLSTYPEDETWGRGLNFVIEAKQRSQNFGPKTHVWLERRSITCLSGWLTLFFSFHCRTQVLFAVASCKQNSNRGTKILFSNRDM